MHAPYARTGTTTLIGMNGDEISRRSMVPPACRDVRRSCGRPWHSRAAVSGRRDRPARSSGAPRRRTKEWSGRALRLRRAAASAPPRPTSERNTARSWDVLLLILDEDAQRCAVEIVELPAAQRPEKSSEAYEPEAEGDRDQDEQPVHRAEPFNRSALPTTISADPEREILSHDRLCPSRHPDRLHYRHQPVAKEDAIGGILARIARRGRRDRGMTGGKRRAIVQPLADHQHPMFPCGFAPAGRGAVPRG